MPAMNGPAPRDWEEDMLDAAMAVKDATEDWMILDMFHAQADTNAKKAFVITIRDLLRVIEPHEPKLWTGMRQLRARAKAR